MLPLTNVAKGILYTPHMIEIATPHLRTRIKPISVQDHPHNEADLQRLLQSFRLPAEFVGYGLAEGQTGEGAIRVSRISQAPKYSTGYHWCVGMAGFGQKDGVEHSFLAHGLPVPETVNHCREAVGRLLSSCDLNTCDFAIFGGSKNPPSGRPLKRDSEATQAALRTMITDETGNRVSAVLIKPSDVDFDCISLAGKSVAIDTGQRRVHIFETLEFKMAPSWIDKRRHQSPEKRCSR